MTSIAIDRLDGLSSSTAIKGPVRVATTANITLSGTQTIDGVAVVADDRVLVKNQTTGSENGIYVVATGAWRRAKDFSRNNDVRKGTQILVTDGTVSADSGYYVDTDNPITIGTTSIVFTRNILNNADAVAVAAIVDEIVDVAGIASDVTTVAGISGDVTTVAGIAANVTTVAGIAANVTTVAGLEDEILAVPAQVTAAETAADEAEASAVEAAASAAAVALPNPAVASTFLQRNAGNTAYDALTTRELLDELGFEVRNGAEFGISSSNNAATNDTAFASAMTWLNGADSRALRLPTGVLECSTTPIEITGNYKLVFGQHHGTLLRLSASATDGAFIRIGDGSTQTNRVSVVGASMWHQKTSGLSEPAIVVNKATDFYFQKSYCTDIPGLASFVGSVSRVVIENVSGSINMAHNVEVLKWAPGAGNTQSAFKITDIQLLDGTYGASTASIVKIAPTGGGLFDSLWMSDFHSWTAAGMPYGIEIDCTGGSAVNMWFTDCCTDKSSSAGVRIANTGSEAYRIRNLRFTNFRADCNNGGKNVELIHSNSNASSRVQGIVFDKPMFPYQSDRTVDVQHTGAGIFDGFVIEGAVFHEHGAATKDSVLYFDADNWSVVNCHFNEMSGSGSVAFALETSADATDFVFANNVIKHPGKAVDFSPWTAIDTGRIIVGNTGTDEPWAEKGFPCQLLHLKTSIGASGAEADLSGTSAVLPAMLLKPGRRVRYQGWGVFAATANTKELKLVTGGRTDTIFSTTQSGGGFDFDVTMAVSTTGPVERMAIRKTLSGGTPTLSVVSLAEAITSDVTVKLRGSGAGTNDLVLHNLLITIE